MEQKTPKNVPSIRYILYYCLLHLSVTPLPLPLPPQMVASEHACYSSVLSYQSRLLLLGLKAVHVVTIKTWKEVCVYIISLSVCLVCCSAVYTYVRTLFRLYYWQ